MKAILSPWTQGLRPPDLPMSTPVMKSTEMARAIPAQAAKTISSLNRMNGVNITNPTSRGARKMMKEMSIMLDLADLPMWVSLRGRSIAFSRSSIRLFCSRFSAS